jgi:hypothetical protein
VGLGDACIDGGQGLVGYVGLKALASVTGIAGEHRGGWQQRGAAGGGVALSGDSRRATACKRHSRKREHVMLRVRREETRD